MSIWSWFDTTEERLQKIEQRELAQQERRNAIEEAQKREQENTPIFQVGTTEDGRVTLRVGQYTNWVTMTDAGVNRLIDMLQAAKGLPNDVEIKEDKE